jgi:hypothetical protein
LEKSVIERELFNELIRLEKEGEDNMEVSVPEPNKKYLVFVATLLDKNQPKQQLIVARYDDLYLFLYHSNTLYL